MENKFPFISGEEGSVQVRSFVFRSSISVNVCCRGGDRLRCIVLYQSGALDTIGKHCLPIVSKARKSSRYTLWPHYTMQVRRNGATLYTMIQLLQGHTAPSNGVITGPHCMQLLHYNGVTLYKTTALSAVYITTEPHCKMILM